MKWFKNISFLSRQIFLLAILFATSCNKHKGAYIRGQVIANDTGNPIPGIDISLIHGYKDKNGAHLTEILATTTSDKDGKYKISYHRKLFNDYDLEWRCEKKDYLPVFDSYLVQHKKLAHTISLIPVGYIRVRLKKNSTSSSWVSFYPNSPDPYNVPAIQKTVPFDTTYQIVARSYSTVETYIVWYYHSSLNSDYETRTDRFIINRGDTITRTLEFD